MAVPRAEIPIVVLSESSPISYISGATVYIKIRSTETLATVYSNSGTTEATITQPLTSDSLGRITGWLPRGAYKAEITIPGKTAYTEYLDVQPGEAGSVDTGAIANEAVTGEKIAAALKNPATATAGLRTLGTGSTEAAAGNDSRFTNERVPTNGSVSTVKIENGAVTEAKLASQSVSTSKITTAFTNQLNTYTTFPGVNAPKITRGFFNAELVQPGGQFQGQASGTIAHGLGTSPGAIQITPFIGFGYTVLMNFRIYESNASWFGWQLYSTQMPSERVTIGAFWTAFT